VGTAWGEAEISFRSCQHLNFDWVRAADGAQGEYRYTRLVQRLLGDGCRFTSALIPLVAGTNAGEDAKRPREL
jgi:hypothetical protein